MLSNKKIKKFFYINAVIIIIYLISFFIENIFFNIQRQILGTENHLNASLLFIPHGVRILAILLFGFHAIPGLFIAQVLTHLDHYPEELYLAMSLNVSTTLSTMIILLIFYQKSSLLFEKINIKNIIFISILTSLVNSILNSLIKDFHHFISHINFNENMIMYFIGDLLGALVFYKLITFTMTQFNTQNIERHFFHSK